MHVQQPRILKVKGADGSEVSVDISNVKMDAGEHAAFQRLLASGDPKLASADDLEKLKNLKAQIQGGDVNTLLIVRFDWKWVRID